MINSFIVASAIAWGAPNPGTVVFNNPEEEAIRAVGKACYKKFELDKLTKTIEKKYLPKELKEYGAWPVMIIKVATEKRISYELVF